MKVNNDTFILKICSHSRKRTREFQNTRFHVVHKPNFPMNYSLKADWILDCDEVLKRPHLAERHECVKAWCSVMIKWISKGLKAWEFRGSRRHVCPDDRRTAPRYSSGWYSRSQNQYLAATRPKCSVSRKRQNRINRRGRTSCGESASVNSASSGFLSSVIVLSAFSAARRRD